MPTTTELFTLTERASWHKVGVSPRNVLAEFPPSILKFQSKADGRSFSLEFAAAFTKATVEPVLAMLCDNMRAKYENAGWKWNENKKRSELLHEDARFLLVTDAEDGSLVAFTHFRFLVEGSCTVLYCYEIQVRADCCRQGIGKRLMTMLEMIARKVGGIQWVMLTVLLNNSEASAFYRRIGYGVDETSPHMDLDSDTKDVPFEILSKKLF